MEDTYEKLTALVVSNTNYFQPNATKIIQIEFGLGKEVSVNAIISIPTLKQWKAAIIFEGVFLISTPIKTQFTLIYKPANTGLPSSVAFDYKNSSDRVRLHHHEKP